MLVNLPARLMEEVALKEIASTHVGSADVSKVWLTRNVKPMEKVFDDRNKECGRLEGAEAKLQALATKNVKKGKTPHAKSTSPKSNGAATTEEGIDLNAETGDSDAIIDRYVLPKKRPHWKQGFLGFFGKKMDLKESPEYIHEKNVEIEKLREGLDDIPKGNVAFMRFNNQHDAHTFARLARKSKETKLVQTGIEVRRNDARG